MDIKSKDKFIDQDIRVESIKNFIIRHLDGVDQERGALEIIEKTTENATEALGRLCELLAEKKILTAIEIAHIATGYAEGSEVYFTEEEGK